MKVQGEKVRLETVAKYCDICGKDITIEDDDRYLVGNYYGRGAPMFTADFCEDCYLKIVDFITSLGGTMNKEC